MCRSNVRTWNKSLSVYYNINVDNIKKEQATKTVLLLDIILPRDRKIHPSLAWILHILWTAYFMRIILLISVYSPAVIR
jgi:hypothetical protein